MRCIILPSALLFYHQLAFSGKILARGDTFEYFYPYWDARNTQLIRAGEAAAVDVRLSSWAYLCWRTRRLGAYYPPNWLTAPFRAPGRHQHQHSPA